MSISCKMCIRDRGKTTRVDLKANWNTPRFTGNYLPNNRNITEKEFSAQWQVLNLNRNYSQVMVDYNHSNIKDIENSSFGVNFKIPVEQYQQSMRSAKYAILIILLTFGVIFFTEIMNKTRIHALQYLLVGLALCLFYSLLLSFSEHIGFNPCLLYTSAGRASHTYYPEKCQNTKWQRKSQSNSFLPLSENENATVASETTKNR